MKRASKSKKSSSSSVVTDDAPPIYLLVHFSWEEGDREYSILKLKPKSGDSDGDDDLKSKAVCFKVPRDCGRTSWLISHLRTSSTDDLYMLPAHFHEKPLPACKFNLRTAAFEKITAPKSSKWCGHVVDLNGRIYYMEQPEVYNDPDSAFECYDPSQEEWSALTPFPAPPNTCRIQATAVWGDDTILYNIAFLTESRTGSLFKDVGLVALRAYVVSEDKWYKVKVDKKEDHLCCTIFGQAVVQGDTIYALTSVQYNLILALSIEKEVIDGDVVLTCSLLSKIPMPDVKPLYDSYDAWGKSRHLVHLGGDSFCVVQCCVPEDFRGYQPIQVIYMKLEGKTMRTTYKCVHKWEIHPTEHFTVKHCFHLPKGMTTALEQGKRFDFDFEFKLVPEAGVAKPAVKVQSVDHHSIWHAEIDDSKFDAFQEALQNLLKLDLTGPIPEITRPMVEEEKAALAIALARDEEGHHSIVVTNLPKNTNGTQVEKGLKKEFGPIKKGGIKLEKNRKGKLYAYVEFETEASKQRAIETGTIRIGDCLAKISNK